MKPAFSSPRGAIAFALLLAVLLALPALVARTGWLDRSDVYPSIAWKFGPFPWIQQEIFAENKDADIVFLGSSHIWCPVNTPYVQSKLSAQLGRNAEVFTLGWPWPGFDASYTIASDLLDHRRVRMLVICDEGCKSEIPHLHSFRWFRIGEHSEALADLPWLAKARLYAGAVLGMPRHLLSLVRPNLLEDPARCRANFWNTYYRAPNLAEQRGALRARLAYGLNSDFYPFEPKGDARPEDVMVYSMETRDEFAFGGPSAQTYSLRFAQRLAQLCQDKGTRLVMLHTPSFEARMETVVSESQPWPQVLGAPVDIIGIPNKKLFAGIPDKDVSKLFYDNIHLNENGQDLFTAIITPPLLQIYDASNGD